MQNRQFFLEWWEHFRQQNGITFRLLTLIPADKLDSRPIGNMRTPKELQASLDRIEATDGRVNAFTEVVRARYAEALIRSAQAQGVSLMSDATH